MIVKLVKIIDKFLVIFDSQVRLQFLHIFYLVFVAYQLFFHFAYDFVAAFISLFHIRVATVELLGLLTHFLEQFLLHIKTAGRTFNISNHF